jgi:hypothetical protein
MLCVNRPLIAVRLYVIMPRNVMFFYAENRLVGLGAKYHLFIVCVCITMWPRGLRRVSATAHFLGLRVRIPPGTLMFVSCECRVCFQVEVSATADHSSRGVLPNVVCL